MVARKRSHSKRALKSGAGLLALGLAALWFAEGSRGQSTTLSSQSPSAQAGDPSPRATTPALPRGKKLLLKDGSFQLVREYKLDGDRVRYYSLDSSQWEEMPAALVDWDATKKAEIEEAERDAAIVAKVEATEKALHAELTLDTDASLEAAPGIFLPPGEGLFAFNGKAIFPLEQSKTVENLSKKQLLKQVLVPIPIIATRHTVSLEGAHSRLRLKNGQPEFYMRTADSREPVMELIRAHIHGDVRQIENLDELFGEQHATRDSISIERWAIAQGVSRFTLSQPLEPGEYVLAEIVQGKGSSLFVWDFGVDQVTPPATNKLK